MNPVIITVYWEHDSTMGISAFLPGFGFDAFDSFSQLEVYCCVEYFGTQLEFVEITSEAQRQALAMQGVFYVEPF